MAVSGGAKATREEADIPKGLLDEPEAVRDHLSRCRSQRRPR